MSPIFSLPRELPQWRAARKRLNCHEKNVHNLMSPNSASEIAVEQYLALKVLWHTQKQTEMEQYLKDIGFEQGIFERMKSSMNRRDAWRLYIEAIGDNANAPTGREPYTRHSILSDDLGGFQLVLQNQLEVVHMISRDGAVETNKVVVTPMLNRLRPRPQRPLAPIAPQTPEQSIFGYLEDVSATKHDEPNLPVADDEQIVNSALVSFLQAVWIDEERKADWTMKRKEFRFHCRDTQAGFIARTDGHLAMNSSLAGKSAAIIEVKARARPRRDPGDHKIEMQESVQMALWIAQEPESHWSSPRSHTKEGPAGDQDKYSKTFHRVLISQDCHQIFITIAEYTKQYIDYLKQENHVTIDDDFALSMRLFGPFRLINQGHMILLGALIKVILTHAANFIQLSSSKESSPENDPWRGIEPLEREMRNINLETPTPAARRGGRRRPQAAPGNEETEQTQRGRTQFQPPPRSGSPSRGPSSRMQEFAAFGPEGRVDRSFAPSSHLNPRRSDEGSRLNGLRQPLRQSGEAPRYRENIAPSGNPPQQQGRPTSPYPEPPRRMGVGPISSSPRSSSQSSSASLGSTGAHVGRDTSRDPFVPRSTSCSPLRQDDSVRLSGDRRQPSPSISSRRVHQSPARPSDLRHENDRH